MIEELFYLDGGHVKITAASVGISQSRWINISHQDIKNDNYKILMKSARLDVLPICDQNGAVSSYFKTDRPNFYDKISRHSISYKDVLPLDTSIPDVIKSFVTENRRFYFLTLHNKITGLITLGNLNCRQVQVYIFALICELERALGEFVDEELTDEQLENLISKKAKTNDKYVKILQHYKELISSDLENKLTEHLFLIDFFLVIEHFNLNTKLSYSKNEWTAFKSINELRNLVAHPTRSLLDKNNDIERLWNRIRKIEELVFRLDQWRQNRND